jgi:hypothetical protein
MSVQIVTNYTPASHILCGIALKETYANFRISVLREVEWATWHGKLKRFPGGKGWCIRKAHLLNLTSALDQYSIPYTISEFIPAPVIVPPTMAVQIAHQLGNESLPAVNDFNKIENHSLPPTAVAPYRPPGSPSLEDLKQAFTERYRQYITPQTDVQPMMSVYQPESFNKKVLAVFDPETGGIRSTEYSVIYQSLWDDWRRVSGQRICHTGRPEDGTFQLTVGVPGAIEEYKIVQEGTEAATWEKLAKTAWEAYHQPGPEKTEDVSKQIVYESKIMGAPPSPVASFKRWWDDWASHDSGRGFDVFSFGRRNRDEDGALLHTFMIYNDMEHEPVRLPILVSRDADDDYVYKNAYNMYIGQKQ